MRITPATVKRWFLKHHGMTFHAFQRSFKINSAFKKLQQGETVLDVALEIMKAAGSMKASDQLSNFS
jgi:methylphosphotriester-DNA--protein-cysteine methyltransferase